MKAKLVKRTVSVRAFTFGAIEPALGGTVRQVAKIQNGLTIEKAKEIAKEIKEVYEPWLAKWMPKLTSNDAPLNPYRVLWDLQKTVDIANTIITI